MEPLVSQVYAFAATIATGAAAGFCYDYYRVVREVFRLKKAGTLVGDAVFWLVTTALVFFLLLRGNGGEVRLYVFIGLGLGALVYFYFFSGPVKRLVRLKFFLLHRTWGILVRSVLLLWTALLFPFRLLAFLLSYPLGLLRDLLHGSARGLRTAFRRLAAGLGLRRIGSNLARLVPRRKKEE